MPGGPFVIVVREKAYREKSGLIALTLHALAHQLADPAGRFGSFTCATLGWLFVSATVLHFTEDAFALQLFLQDAKRLINIVVSYGYVHGKSLSFAALPNIAGLPVENLCRKKPTDRHSCIKDGCLA